MRDVTKVMEEAFEKVFSEGNIGAMCSPNTTDWQRGEHAGKIWMAQWIAREINSNDEEMDEDEIITAE